jgi:mannose-6-phosphate isomerase
MSRSTRTETDLAVGTRCDIAMGQVHRLANRTEGPVEIVEMPFGNCLGKNNIKRLQDDYGRT